MPRVYDIQNNFARGEMSPRLHARTDIDHYRLSLLECTNFFVLRQGALRKRQATEYIATTKVQSEASRHIPFVFSTEQAYMLEFGDQYFRPYANGARITDTPLTITGATQANPVVLSVVNSLSNGDRVFVQDVVGMTEINNREFTVANQTGTTIELSGEDGTGHTAYSSAGTVGELVEFATPYLEAELFDIQFAQSADTLYVAHKNHAPRKITRSSDTSWTVTEIDFQDGPFLPQTPGGTATNLTLSADGNVIPDMTSNTAPSGTVAASGGAATAWQAADRDKSTELSQVDSGDGWWEYDAGSAKTVVGYTLTAHSGNPESSPIDFTFQGFDGVDWITLDSQLDVDPWGDGETRYFPFDNDTSYDKYRLKWTRIQAGTTTQIAEIGFKESPDTMAAITLTASGTTDINDGTGFQTTDVGRPIRIRGSDGVWRWFEIETRSSTTVVTGVLYGQLLPDLEPTTSWRLGAFSSQSGYPQSVSFFEERLCWARTNQEPQKIWGSKTFGFEDHGVSSPLVDDDAFTVEIASDQVNEIKWLSEAGDLIIGTSDGIRTLGPSDTSKAFSATNLRQREQTKVGSSDLFPARVGNVAIFADRLDMALHELVFSFEANSFTAPELSIISDHLVTSGIVAMDYAQSPDSIVWLANGLGELIPMTFERDQRIVGMSRCPIGGDGFVESLATIPGSDRDELWLIVRRTINGGTVRYVERLSGDFEGDSIEDSRYLDSYLQRTSGAVTEVSGLGHLEGETVGIIADGFILPDATVTDGKITLASAATNIAVGLRYTGKIRQLRVAIPSRDGSLMGRRANVPEITLDVYEAQKLKVGRDGNEKALFDEVTPDTLLTLQTGTFRQTVQGSWDDEGLTSIVSDQPMPATIRAVVRGYDFEP